MSASNPVLGDVHEYILVFSKGSFERVQAKRARSQGMSPWSSSRVYGVLPSQQAGLGIQHHSHWSSHTGAYSIHVNGDIVLDPFVGSSTTCIAALVTGRHYIGMDVDERYVTLARRIEEYNAQRRLTEF